jgi:hypothetical protein
MDPAFVREHQKSQLLSALALRAPAALELPS